MILALSTTGQATELRLLPSAATSASQAVATDQWDSGRQLASDLLERIKQLLKSQQLKLSDLTGIAILRGPGSFTSLRIGHTVANTLADSLNIPIAGSQEPNWLEHSLKALADQPTRQPVWPVYGAEANITPPKLDPRGSKDV